MSGIVAVALFVAYAVAYGLLVGRSRDWAQAGEEGETNG